MDGQNQHCDYYDRDVLSFIISVLQGFLFLFKNQHIENLCLEYKPLYGIIILTELQNKVLPMEKSKSIREK